MGKTAVKSKNEKQGAKGKFFFLLSEDFVLVNNMFSNTSVLHALFQFLPYSPILLSSNFMDSLFSPLSPFSAVSTGVRQFAGAWAVYQGPLPCRKPVLPP